MPNTSTSGSSGQSGNRSRNRNQNRNRSRNRSSNRNSDRNSDSNRNSDSSRNSDRKRSRSGERSGDRQQSGSRSGGYTREKVPRRAPKPSFWQRVLAIFGLAGDKPSKTKAAPAAGKTPKPSTGKRRGDAPRSISTASGPPAPKKKRAARAPEKVEVTGPRLYVGNLSYDTTEEDLGELFNGVGNVESVEVITHRQSQRSKGYAFVVLRSADEARRAVDVLHDKDFMGRKLIVNGAKSEGPADKGSNRDDSTAAV